MSVKLKSQYHLFRYASEWDPREKGKTKGGYLEGKIELPSVSDGMKVVISTYPTSLPNNPPAGVEDVHPTLLHVVRKTRNRRLNELEPVPNIHHWRQEFIIANNTVTVVNRVSNMDEERSVPDQDQLFPLNDERVLSFGKEIGEINMIILIPKTDARAHGKDVTLKDLLKSRIQDTKDMKIIEDHYKGKNSVNLKKVRLKVDFYKHQESTPYDCVISETISDTASKHLGAMDFHDATPLRSCQFGGRKVVMVAEFGLAIDVEPRFQLFDRHGTRQKHLEDNSEYIIQPMASHKEPTETVAVFKESIIFITPPQPNLARILAEGMSIMLVGRRRSDEFESRKRFPFSYETHKDDCVYCLDNPDGVNISVTGHAALAPKKEVPRPGRKKRRMSGNDVEDVSTKCKYSPSRSFGNTEDLRTPTPIRKITDGFSQVKLLSPKPDESIIKTEVVDIDMDDHTVSHDYHSAAAELYTTVQQLLPSTGELFTAIQEMSTSRPIYTKPTTLATTREMYTTLQPSSTVVSSNTDMYAAMLQHMPATQAIHFNDRPVYRRRRSEEIQMMRPYQTPRTRGTVIRPSYTRTSNSAERFLELYSQDYEGAPRRISLPQWEQETALDLVKKVQDEVDDVERDKSLHPKLRFKSKSVE